MSTAGFEVLAYEETPLGVLCLRRREILQERGTYVTEITLNHEFLMSSYNTESERALSRLALEMHKGSSLEVLVGGLGLGYTAQAVLASDRVASLQVSEFLPQVIEWMKAGLVPLSEELNAEKRLSIAQEDFYAKLELSPTQKYDLILVDIDHSPKEQLNLQNKNEQFYTVEGLQKAKTHLKSGGILGVWSYAESSPFASALETSFKEVRIEKIPFENKLLGEKHTDWLFFARD